MPDGESYDLDGGAAAAAAAAVTRVTLELGLIGARHLAPGASAPFVELLFCGNVIYTSAPSSHPTPTDPNYYEDVMLSLDVPRHGANEFDETLFVNLKDRGGFGGTRVLATTAIPLGKKLRSLGQLVHLDDDDGTTPPPAAAARAVDDLSSGGAPVLADGGASLGGGGGGAAALTAKLLSDTPSPPKSVTSAELLAGSWSVPTTSIAQPRCLCNRPQIAGDLERRFEASWETFLLSPGGGGGARDATSSAGGDGKAAAPRAGMLKAVIVLHEADEASLSLEPRKPRFKAKELLGADDRFVVRLHAYKMTQLTPGSLHAAATAVTGVKTLLFGEERARAALSRECDPYLRVTLGTEVGGRRRICLIATMGGATRALVRSVAVAPTQKNRRWPRPLVSAPRCAPRSSSPLWRCASSSRSTTHTASLSLSLSPSRSARRFATSAAQRRASTRWSTRRRSTSPSSRRTCPARASSRSRRTTGSTSSR